MGGALVGGAPDAAPTISVAAGFRSGLHAGRMRRLSYPLLCALCGFVLGWIPMFLHVPIPEKFDLFYLRGAVAVWSWYAARLLVGVMVGITWWPPRWYLRGPLCGFLMILPCGIMSLAVPTCGAACMFWNEGTAAALGFLVAGIAYWSTGKHHALARGERRLV